MATRSKILTPSLVRRSRYLYRSTAALSFFSTELVISSDMLDNSQLGLGLLPWTPRSYSAAARARGGASHATHEGRRRARGGRIRYSRFYDTGAGSIRGDKISIAIMAAHASKHAILSFRPESLERCSLGNKSQLSVCHCTGEYRTGQS